MGIIIQVSIDIIHMFEISVAGLGGAASHRSSCPISLDKLCKQIIIIPELQYLSCCMNPIAKQHTLNVVKCMS